MTNFPQHGYYDPTMTPTGEMPRRSGLAVTAMVFAVIALIACLGTAGLALAATPPAQMMLVSGCGGCLGLVAGAIGLLLGAIGLIAIRPPKTGKGMSALAVVLSIASITVQAYVGKMYLIDPIRGYIDFAMTGPQDALTKGFSGDTAGFKASFDGAGASASDAEATAFIAQLRSRYGNFTSAAFDEQPGQSAPTPQPGQTKMTLPYNLTFDGKTVKADVELIFVDQSGRNIVKRLGVVHVIDPDLGDLMYPTSAAPAPAPQGAGTTQPGSGAGAPPAPVAPGQ